MIFYMSVFSYVVYRISNNYPNMKFTIKTLTILALLSAFSILLSTKVEAAVTEVKNTRTYEVQGDFVQINEYKDVTIVQNNAYIPAGTNIKYTIFTPNKDSKGSGEKIQQTLDSLSVSMNGVSQNFAYSEYGNNSYILDVTLSRDISPAAPGNILISYRSYGLSIKSGKVIDVYVPSFASDFQFEDEDTVETYSTKVLIPRSLGEINFVTTTSSIAETEQYREITIAQEDLIGNTAWIQVGTQQIYKFELKQKVLKSSDTFLGINKYTMIIPRSIVSGQIIQKVYYEHITPAPLNIIEDANGNLVATFIFSPNEEHEILLNGYAVLDQNNNLEFSNSGFIKDIESSIIDANTKPGEFWESDNSQIIETAREIVSEEELQSLSVWEILQKTYKFVVDRIDYSQVKKYGLNERQGALATLNGKAAVCMEYSDLFIALMRANGIPARAAFGFGYSSYEDVDSSDKAENHQWVEVYIPEFEKWIPVDTTWGENGDAVIGGDLNHFYTHVASISPNEPNTLQVTYFGQIPQVPERESKVEAIDTMPDVKDLISSEELLNIFPQKSAIESSTPYLITRNVGRTFIYGFDNFLSNTLGIQSEQTRYILKVSVFIILPLILVVIVSVRYIRKRMKETRVKVIQFDNQKQSSF